MTQRGEPARAVLDCDVMDCDVMDCDVMDCDVMNCDVIDCDVMDCAGLGRVASQRTPAGGNMVQAGSSSLGVNNRSPLGSARSRSRPPRRGWLSRLPARFGLARLGPGPFRVGPFRGLGAALFGVGLLGVGLLGAGCAALPLDRSVSLGSPAEPTPPLRDVQVHGFVIEVELHDGLSLEGELLAVDEQYLWIVPHLRTSGVASGRVRRILLDEVSEVELQVHESDSAVVGLWTLGGALSTPSHGWFLVFSFPTWVITGSITSSLEGGTNDTHSEARRDHLRLYQYARFPQGIPDSFREQALASGDE